MSQITQNANAQYNLGVMYEGGQGVPQDYEKAVHLYTEAAGQGFAAAQNNLGGMCRQGQGVPQDYKKAFEWFTKAAQQGFAAAQNNLGAMYGLGQGVPQDPKKAIEWYTKAAQQGFDGAKYSLGGMYYRGEGVSKDDPQNKIEAYVWLQLGMGRDPERYRAFGLAAEKLTQEEEDKAEKLFKKRREEIHKRKAEASATIEIMGVGVWSSRKGVLE